jgi:signal transduction histidine kinase
MEAPLPRESFRPLDALEHALVCTRDDLVLKPIDLRDVVRAAIAGTESVLIGRQHALAAHICVQHLPVLGDGAKLGIVVAHLIRTAVRYGTGRGLVTLRTWLDGWHACVSLTDSGPGLAGDLGIARRMVEMHGGHLEVRSGDGEVVVYLRLPAATGATGPAVS